MRSDASGTTIYLPGGQEIKITASTVTASRYYSFAGSTVATRTGSGLGAVTSLVSDQHGSVVASVPNTVWTASSVTRVFSDPFGAVRGGSDGGVPGDHRFLGAVLDAGTGLTLLGARYYDALVGSFISVDPQLNPANAAQFNAYNYSGNNPLTWSDPSGLDFWSDLAKNAKNALNTAGSWVKAHSAEIIGTVAGVVVGVVVTGACLAGTAGIGSVGCLVLGGMAGGAVAGALTAGIQLAQSGKPLTWQSAVGVVQSAYIGAAFGALGGLAGAGAGVLLGKVATSLAGSLAGGATGGSIRTALTAAAQRVTQRISQSLVPSRPSPQGFGSGSGPWTAGVSSSPGGAVGQITNGSCVSACGMMLSNGARSQSSLLGALGNFSNPKALAAELGEGWTGGMFGSADDAIAAASKGPMGATLQAGTGPGHMVVTNPLGNGRFLVQDPWAGGSTYEVGTDWVGQFVSGGTFRQ